MKKINMKRFCNQIAADYHKERVERVDAYKDEEWRIIKRRIKKNQKVLDLCCGPGTFLVPLAKEGYNIEGIDFSSEMLKQAKEFAKKENTRIRTSIGDARNIRRKNNQYDLVLLMGDSIGSIPKSENRQRVIDECFRVLKNGGTLIVTFGNKYYSVRWTLNQILLYIWRAIMSHFGNELIEFGDWIDKMYGRTRIHHNYSKKEVLESLKKSGFRIKSAINIAHKFIFVTEKP